MSLFPFVAQSENPNAMLALLTLTSADNSTTLRVVNNAEPVNSDGHEFQPYPFQIILAGDTGDRVPTISLTLDNVDQLFMGEMRKLYESPSIVLQLVWSHEPDTVEKEIDFLKISTIEYDAMTITGSLAPHTFLSERFPRGIYDAAQYPDLFYSVS